ncbi:MAG: GreA/GreB family elongation factor [Myxococcales bacterium]|jgi:transcription elongation GreA/GreB family factor
MELDKAQVLAALRARVEEDLGRAMQAQKATQAGATHEEARPENDKDTRALEQTYLARGLAERVVALEEAREALRNLRLRDLGPDDPVAVGALVALEDEVGEQRSLYFITPHAGGVRIEVQGVEVATVTPRAPVGRALIGCHAGDDVRIRTPQGARELVVVEVG